LSARRSEEERQPTCAEKPRSKLVPFVIGGVGVASLIASGVFFGLRQGAISDLDGSCPSRTGCDPSLKSTEENGRLYGTVSLITLAAGVVGLGVGGTLLLLSPPSSDGPPAAARLQLSPVAGPSLAGASFSGAF
jgi:hypothetical protein